MHGVRRSRPAQLAALAATLIFLVAMAAAAAAGAPPGTHRATSETQLDTRVHRALLDLYALDSRRQAARTRVSSLERATTRLRRQRTALGQERAGARATLQAAQQELAFRLRTLYEEGTVDPVAVMLGAASIQAALERLDGLKRTADEDRRLVTEARAAAARLLRVRERLGTAARGLERALAGARVAERSLASATADRLAYVTSLRSQLQAVQVRNVVATAQTVEVKSQRLQRQKGSPPQPQQPAPSGGRKLVVKATCYDLPGTTATGMPVGPGVVAVDPSVIPLGTRLYIPGYGKGVAADVGGGIRGNIIDLWYATYAQCAAWGVRTVTITIY